MRYLLKDWGLASGKPTSPMDEAAILASTPRITGSHVDPTDNRPLAEIAAEYRAEAFNTWLEVMRDPLAPPATRLKAAENITERSDGKAPAVVHQQGGGVTNIQVNVFGQKKPEEFLAEAEEVLAVIRETEQQKQIESTAVETETVEDNKGDYEHVEIR